MAKAEQAQAAETEATDVEAGVPESISLNDLGLLLNIVDLASKRGAFQGAELSQVGAIFDKLNAFLTFVQEQQNAADESEAGGAEEAAEE